MPKNSQLARSQRPTVFVFEDRAIWSTAIAVSKLDCNITRVFNFDDLLSQCSQTHGSLAVIEIDLANFSSATNDSLLVWNAGIVRISGCPFFAVGDKRLKKYHNQLLTVGFCGVFGGIMSVDRLVRLARQYFDRVVWPPLTVQQRVTLSMPWQATK